MLETLFYWAIAVLAIDFFVETYNNRLVSPPSSCRGPVLECPRLT